MTSLVLEEALTPTAAGQALIAAAKLVALVPEVPLVTKPAVVELVR